MCGVVVQTSNHGLDVGLSKGILPSLYALFLSPETILTLIHLLLMEP